MSYNKYVLSLYFHNISYTVLRYGIKFSLIIFRSTSQDKRIRTISFSEYLLPQSHYYKILIFKTLETHNTEDNFNDV